MRTASMAYGIFGLTRITPCATFPGPGIIKLDDHSMPWPNRAGFRRCCRTPPEGEGDTATRGDRGPTGLGRLFIWRANSASAYRASESLQAHPCLAAFATA